MILSTGKCYKYKDKLYHLVGVDPGPRDIGYLKDPAAKDNRKWHVRVKLSLLEPIDEDKLSLYLKEKHLRPVIMDKEDEAAWKKYLAELRGDKDIINEF